MSNRTLEQIQDEFVEAVNEFSRLIDKPCIPGTPEFEADNIKIERARERKVALRQELIEATEKKFS